jgi:UDP-N-acetylmuramate dehydrogenase
MNVINRTMRNRLTETQRETLLSTFGEQLQRFVSLARFTAVRVGGAADWLITVESADQLAGAAMKLWSLEIPFFVLGGGSNVLISDTGVHDVVILNNARNIRFDLENSPPLVWAESGVNFGLLARQAASRGLSGLEWAAGIPGTVGGAVFGNAGAHGDDMGNSLHVAEILHRTKDGVLRESWQVERLAYDYRSSLLKRDGLDAVILAACFEFQTGNSDEIRAQMDNFNAYRRRTQPSGASMGSIFKNPPDDYAGRLIEAAGLKGTRFDGVEISPVHANFFINHEGATASDFFELIKLVQAKVAEKFGVDLELEIELIGDFPD